MIQKNQTRKKLHGILNGLGDRAIFEKSLMASERLCRLPEFENAKVVMMFFSVHREIDTSFALIEALRQHKTLVLPRINWEKKSMDPVRIETLNCEIAVGRKAVREPVGGEIIPISEIDLVVTPGLGFDDCGGRIGRGAAFYDRFFSQEDFRGTRCGFTFEEQVLDSIPMAPHDQTMNLLCTDVRVHRFNLA